MSAGPWAVEVVQGDGAILDVGADAHLGRGADEDVDLPGAALLEQQGLLAVVGCVVDELHSAGVHAAFGEQAAQVAVDVES